MKASELLERIARLKAEHGDLPIYLWQSDGDSLEDSEITSVEYSAETPPPNCLPPRITLFAFPPD